MQDTVSSADKLHHEDLAIGKPYECGTKTVTRDEILAFGRAYDPQPLHVDEEAAKKTLVGGLCASGWHTCTMMMRLVADGVLNRVASLGSPSVDEGRWMVPVRPGDEVRARYTVLEKRDLASRPANASAFGVRSKIVPSSRYSVTVPRCPTFSDRKNRRRLS